MMCKMLVLGVGLMVTCLVGSMHVETATAAPFPPRLYCRYEYGFTAELPYGAVRFEVWDCIDSERSPRGIPPLAPQDSAICNDGPATEPGDVWLMCRDYAVEDLPTWPGLFCLAASTGLRWGDPRRGIFGSNAVMCADAREFYYAGFGRR